MQLEMESIRIPAPGQLHSVLGGIQEYRTRANVCTFHDPYVIIACVDCNVIRLSLCFSLSISVSTFLSLSTLELTASDLVTQRHHFLSSLPLSQVMRIFNPSDSLCRTLSCLTSIRPSRSHNPLAGALA